LKDKIKNNNNKIKNKKRPSMQALMGQAHTLGFSIKA
jgi:hypothetical protein